MNIENKLIEVTNRTVMFQSWINSESQSNAGAMAFNDYIIALDPSPEAYTAPKFREAIETHFNLPVKYLLVSHIHGDHTRGVSAFKDITILGSSQLYRKMQKEGKEILPQIQFNEKLVFEDSNSLIEFHYANGHTDCSTFAYSPSEKVLFAGDLVFANCFPWAGDSSCNPEKWIGFYDWCLKLDFDHLIPGHGPLVDKSEIALQLKLIKQLKQSTLEAIKRKESIRTIPRPAIYPENYESRFKRTAQHFYNFYSNF